MRNIGRGETTPRGCYNLHVGFFIHPWKSWMTYKLHKIKPERIFILEFTSQIGFQQENYNWRKNKAIQKIQFHFCFKFMKPSSHVEHHNLQIRVTNPAIECFIKKSYCFFMKRRINVLPNILSTPLPSLNQINRSRIHKYCSYYSTSLIDKEWSIFQILTERK